MRKIINIVSAFLLIGLVSCSHQEMYDKLSDLESRIAALEDVYSEINTNATALNVLYRQNILITGYEDLTQNGSMVGYKLKFSDGQVATITLGSKMEGMAPMLGFDEYGRWAYSVDGGESFVTIEGAASPGAVDGKTPKISVDKYGFWIISIDGGASWERILNPEGDVISAVDGRSMAVVSYSFFKRVNFNKKNCHLDIELVSGLKFSVPLLANPKVELQYYSEQKGAYVYGGRVNEFPATIEGVEDALFVDAPKGWRLWLEDSKLCVETSEDCPSGTYPVKLLTIGHNGQSKAFDFNFSYEPDLILYDDFDGDDIDYRYWARYKHGPVTSEWDTYQEGKKEESVVEDGLLKLYAHIDGALYRTGAVWSGDKFTYKPPFRIDCRGRFTQMGTGIWYAIWTRPKTSYMYGEIDIVEKLNFGTTTYHTCHTQYTLNTEKSNQKLETYVNEKGETVPNDNQGIAYNAMVPGAFNVFSVELTDEQIVWYVNDIPVHVYKHFEHTADDPLYARLKEKEKQYYFLNWTFMEQDYVALLNIAVGGQFVGGVIKNEEFPGQFDIDWIKIKSLK